MIQKVLIADHGNVAVRLVWEFKRAAVKTVTVSTEEIIVHPTNTDFHAMLTQLCNEPADRQLEPLQQPVRSKRKPPQSHRFAVGAQLPGCGRPEAAPPKQSSGFLPSPAPREAEKKLQKTLRIFRCPPGTYLISQKTRTGISFLASIHI